MTTTTFLHPAMIQGRVYLAPLIAPVVLVAIPVSTSAIKVKISQQLNKSQIGANSLHALSAILGGMVDNLTSLTASMALLTAKLDKDPGVSGTDYAMTTIVTPPVDVIK
jgi:hypothetical protein